MKKMEQHQQPQQDVQDSRKRSMTEHGDNGRSEKSKKLDEKNGTQVDLKDGANMSIQLRQYQQVTMRV